MHIKRAKVQRMQAKNPYYLQEEVLMGERRRLSEKLAEMEELRSQNADSDLVVEKLIEMQ